MEKYALAHNRVRKLARLMRKQADVYNESISGPVADALTLGISKPIGDIVGMASKAPSIEKIKEWDEHPGYGLLPGVSAARAMGRQKALRHLLKENPKAFDVPWSDMLTISPLVYGALGAGAGAGIGHYAGGHAGLGALIGAGLGAGGASAAEALGGFFGLTTPKRTLAEQAKAENRKANWLLNSIIPGRGMYNLAKRLNTSQRLSNMSPEEIEKEIAAIKAERGE